MMIRRKTIMITAIMAFTMAGCIECAQDTAAPTEAVTTQTETEIQEEAPSDPTENEAGQADDKAAETESREPEVKAEDENTTDVTEDEDNTTVSEDNTTVSEAGDTESIESLLGGISMEEYTKMILEQAKEGEKKFPVTLDKKDSSKDVNPIDGGLFITADGVELRSMEISFSGEVLSFGIELYNETGSDKNFDQTKFVIEKEDGTFLNPFVFEQVREPETVRAEFKRLWMAYTVYDPKGLNVGDDVSVYYDGVFITTLTVTD